MGILSYEFIYKLPTIMARMKSRSLHHVTALHPGHDTSLQNLIRRNNLHKLEHKLPTIMARMKSRSLHHVTALHPGHATRESSEFDKEE